MDSNRTFLYARHLDTALSFDKLEFYQNQIKLWNLRYPKIPHSFIQIPVNGFVRGTNIFIWTYSNIIKDGCRNTTESANIWTHLSNSAATSLDLQLEAMYGLFPGIQLGSFRARKDLACSGPNVRRAFQLKHLVTKIHYSISELSNLNSYPFIPSCCPILEFHRDLVVLRTFPGSPLVVPYSIVLGVLDKIESEFAYEVYNSIKSVSPLALNLGFLSLTEKVSSFLWNMHKSLGVEGARVCKLLEPICLGVSLEILPPDSNDVNFCNGILQDIRMDRPNIYPHVIHLTQLLREYLQTHGEKGIPTVLEQYGHEKRFFYPIVDEDAGLKKMYTYGTEIRVIDRDFVVELKGLATLDYILVYYNKHGTLPPFITDPTLDARILEIQSTGTPQSLEYCMRIPYSEWAKIVFEKHWDFNYYEDITDLLDDKAITPHRENWRQLFAYDALNILGQSRRRKHEDTKLIMAILQREVIDIKEFYHTVESLGYIPLNWTLIQAMAKERELKIEARMFSILVLEIRMMCSVTERNIKEGILRLYPQQSITMSGPELKAVLDNMVQHQIDEEFVWVAFNLDLEQWNYTFRYALQYPFAQLLCQIYGVRHFITVLFVFLESIILSSRKFCPPGTPGRVTNWSVHIGGNQGIFQALWSWITITIERFVLLTFGYLFLEIGSGDNRVILVRLPNDNQLQFNINRIRDRLREAFAKTGLALKVEETWYSSCLLAYQRKYWFRGKQVENGIKQVTRSYAGGADIALGLDEMITTAMNGGLTISEVTLDPVIGPLFAYLEGLSALCCHPLYQDSLLSKGQFLALLPLFNTDFGYYPFTQLIGFMYSGHPDSLTDSISLVSKIWSKYPHLQSALASMLKWTREPDKIKAAESLVTSPSSLCLKKPSVITAHLKQAVQDYLFVPSHVKNIKIKTLLSSVAQLDKQQYIQSLFNIEPINASLLHTLLSSSYIGQVEGMVNHFNRVGSLVQTVELNKIAAGDCSFQSLVNTLDSNYIKYIDRRLRTSVTISQDWLHAYIGSTLAEYIYFCNIHHLEMYCTFSVRLFLTSFTHHVYPQLVNGPYSPSPIEQIHPYFLPEVKKLTHSIVVSPARSIPSSSQQLATKRGPFKPLLGSSTANPARTLKLTSLQGLDVSKAIRELLKIFSWLVGMNADQKILQFIKDQLNAKVPGISSVMEILVTGTRGGTFEHRFSMAGQVMGAYSNNPSPISTWYQLSTNAATTLQRGSEDRYVFFQVLFQYIMSGLRFCEPSVERWYCEILLSHCGYLIPDEKFSLTTNNSLQLTPDPHITPLAPGIEAKLKMEADHLLMLSLLPTIPATLNMEILASVISHQFARYIKQYQLGSRSIESHHSTGGSPQSSFNVTLLRMVSLPALLVSLALHCFHHHIWSPTSSLTKFSHTIQSMLLRGSSAQDSGPYMPFIEALVTAGHLPQLIVLSSASVKWSSGSLHSQLVSVLLRGILYGVDQLLKSSVRSILIVEAQSTTYHWPFLWRTLQQFSRSFKDFISKTPHVTVQFGMAMYLKEKPKVMCKFTSDVHLVEEHLRSIWKSSLSSIVKQNYPTLTQPLRTTVLLNPAYDLYYTTDGSSKSPKHKESLQDFLNELSNHHLRSFASLYSIGRWGGVSSSARLKLHSLLHIVPHSWSSDVCHFTLAEGAGSYASLLLHLLPNDTVIYNSLLPPEELPHCFSTSFTPYECLCTCNISSRLLSQHVLQLNYGDLTHKETWDGLRTTFRNQSKPAGILTFDMEGYDQTKNTVYRFMYDFIAHIKPKGIVLKVFLEDFISPSSIQLQKIVSQFQYRHICKPTASNLWSSEVFLGCSTYKYSKGRSSLQGISQIVMEWSKVLRGLTLSTMWDRILALSQYWEESEACPLLYPSTQSCTPPLHHPINQILISIGKTLCWLLTDYILIGLSIPRGTSHMFLSRSKGTKAMCSYLYSTITIVATLLQWTGFAGNTLSSDILASTWSSRTDSDISKLMCQIKELKNKGDQIAVSKIVGEIISSKKDLDGALCDGLLSCFQVLPTMINPNWRITPVLQQCLPVLMATTLVELPQEDSLPYQTLINLPLRDQLRGLVSLGSKSKKGELYDVNLVPATLVGAFHIGGIIIEGTISVTGRFQIVDRSVVSVHAYNPNEINTLIQWGPLHKFGELELASIQILHKYEIQSKPYVLGLWWIKPPRD